MPPFPMSLYPSTLLLVCVVVVLLPVSRPALERIQPPCTMGTGGPFPEGKARPGRDADHSPPSTAEVVNE
jgi:hypothetical protein